MWINMVVESPADGPGSGPVTVGWFRATERHGVLYDPPERVSFRDTNRSHGKSASRCPAIISLESRYFMVRCPFDLHIGFARDKEGRAVLVNRTGSAGPVRPAKLNEVLTLVSEAEWRYPDRPTLQLQLPYVFIADEMVYLSQVDAFAHYRRQPLPGTIFGGRFPIHVWPRPLMWAFEWHDTDRDLVLKRGEPLFYCQFEGIGPDRPVHLTEAERTPELLSYMDHVGGAVNFVNQTFSLFKAAEAARPARLLKARERR
ncbi:hypothetical protein [Halodurantibacterium flavum]|uniref:Uncharacterized protein n=1 Tax=Halodurantibacterium flavum TaxID=1382802 RepID=A0ABW4SBR0_9RHOB